MALPGQQGQIGPEGNDPHHNDPPAPADKDNTKPMYSSYKKVLIKTSNKTMQNRLISIVHREGDKMLLLSEN